MATARTVHSDQWGDILDRPDEGCVEIRWFDTTEAMGTAAFNGSMIGHIEQQFTIPLGVEVEIDADAGTIRMREPAVT